MRPELNGALAALSVVAVSLLAVVGIAVLGWVLAADHSSLAAMFDVAILGWLAVHLVPIQTVGGWIWLPPLLLTAALVWWAYRVGRTSLRRSTFYAKGARWRLIATALASYAGAATLLALVASGGEVGVPVWLVPIAAAMVFGAGFVPAVARTTGTWRDWTSRIPTQLVTEGRAAVRGLLALAGGAGLALLVALVGSWTELQQLWSDLRPGFSGTAVLVLGCVAYLPTAVVWTASFLLGSGIELGSAGAVTPFAATTAELPGFPLFAAIPDGVSGWYLAGFLLPVIAGIVTATSVTGGQRSAGVRARMMARLRAAGIAAVAAGVVGALTHGTMGGALSGLGPPLVLFPLALLFWFGVGAAAVTTVESARLGRLLPRRFRGKTDRGSSAAVDDRTGTIQVVTPDEQAGPEWTSDRTVVLAEEHAQDLGR